VEFHDNAKRFPPVKMKKKKKGKRMNIQKKEKGGPNIISLRVYLVCVHSKSCAGQENAILHFPFDSPARVRMVDEV
jgi:hypothetical protein